jgi:DNA polymerase-3 subunit alpha
MINFITTDFSCSSILKADQVKTPSILCDTNLSGIVEYFNACKDNDLKPVISYFENEIYLARNQDEYHDLLKRYSRNQVSKQCLHLVGAPFGALANLVTESYFPYRPADDAFEKAVKHLKDYQKVWDLEVVLAITPYEGECYEGLRDLLRDVAKELGLKTCIVDSAHYLDNSKENIADQKIICGYNTKILLKKYYEMDGNFRRFFESDQYYIRDWSSFPEYKTTQEIYDSCEEYDILSDPQLPNIENGMEKLRDLCREGYKEKELFKRENKQVYIDRIKEELDIIEESGFASYFLILYDLCQWVDSQGWFRGFSRGSAAGCILLWLTDVTKVDPIEYDLLFNRFYNKDRAEAKQLPDVDLDIPKTARDGVIKYLNDKYGETCVAKMATYMELQGRSALTTVMRYNETASFDEIKQITAVLPQKDKVSDELENVGEKSLIRYVLEYMPDRLSNYARLEKGKVVGDYADDFEQAIRLEGTKTQIGTHASAIIVADKPIETLAPLMWDIKGEEKIVGLTLHHGEAAGLLKLDILGLANLDANKLALTLVEENAL